MKPFLYTLTSIFLVMAGSSVAQAQQTPPSSGEKAPRAKPKAIEEDPFKDVKTGLTFNLGQEQDFQKFAQLMADRHDINAAELGRFLDESMDQEEVRDMVNRLAKQERQKSAKNAPDIEEDELDELREVDQEMDEEDTSSAQPREVKSGS